MWIKFLFVCENKFVKNFIVLKIFFVVRVLYYFFLLIKEFVIVKIWEIYYYFRRVFIVIFVYFDVYDFSEYVKENFLDDGWDGVVFLVFVVDVESEDGYICG